MTFPFTLLILRILQILLYKSYNLTCYKKNNNNSKMYLIPVILESNGCS